MGELKIEGNYLIHESGRKTKLYITHKTRNSGHAGDLTAVAKSIIREEHATNKNNLHEVLAEPKNTSDSKPEQPRSKRNIK